MVLQNFKGDFIVAQTFYRQETEEGKSVRKQIPVPDRVIVEFFTSPSSGIYKVERDRKAMSSCSLSADGMVLYCNVALSRHCIGTGRLYRNVIEVEQDASFPQGTKFIPSPDVMDIMLYPGKSDGTDEILSEALLDTIRYGYSAYQLAVLHGYQGTEEEWLESFRIDSASVQEISEIINNLK